MAHETASGNWLGRGAMAVLLAIFQVCHFLHLMAGKEEERGPRRCYDHEED